MEVWKDISGFENYQISNYGNVKSLNYGRTGKPKLLKPTVSGKGYLQVRLSKFGKPNALLVHRLVAMAFVPHLFLSVYQYLKTNRKRNLFKMALLAALICLSDFEVTLIAFLSVFVIFIGSFKKIW